MLGFEDYGNYEDIKQVADHNLTFLIRSFCVPKWKFPIGYFLVKKSTKPDLLVKLINYAVIFVRGCGLIPKLLVCDQSTTNR